MGRNDPLRKGVRLIHAGESPKRLLKKKSLHEALAEEARVQRVCLCAGDNTTLLLVSNLLRFNDSD